jgi:hypothetical protein
MTKIRESAAERRAREAVEARAAQEAWERQRPALLLEALARAHDLNVSANMSFTKQGELYYWFNFDEDGYATEKGMVSDLAEWQMQNIVNRLAQLEQERDRQRHLREVRAQLIATLTDEQKEALGLK